jgi:hypothetical protein
MISAISSSPLDDVMALAGDQAKVISLFCHEFVFCKERMLCYVFKHITFTSSEH